MSTTDSEIETSAVLVSHEPPAVDFGALYQRARLRIAEFALSATPAQLATVVPNCPAWTVADVVGHVTGIVEDAIAGRLTGPPDEAMAATQVARHKGEPIASVVAAWERGAPAFESFVTAAALWPAAFDVSTHEQDIRHALGLPNTAEQDVFAIVARMALPSLTLPNGQVLIASFPDGSTASSAVPPDPAPTHDGTPACWTVQCQPFDFVSARIGRQSFTDSSAFIWSSDPTPILASISPSSE
jgi:uncharacterized protein (TIGR03083 family)